MKNLFLFILISISYISAAQGFKGGVLVGVIAAQVDGDAWGGYHKLGLQGGIYSKYQFNEKWDLSLEVKYIQKGSFQTFKDDPMSNFKIALAYVELPLIINYNYNKKISFGGGLSYAYLVSAQVDDAGGTIGQEHLNYRKYDVNLMSRFKYQLNDHIWFDLRFAYSLFSIKEDQYNRQWNNLFALGLGYEL